MKWTIDKNRPICPQIEEQICARIAVGELTPGERLSSVRDVAIEAGVNPNTVQKAFSELERDGLIFSRIGSGWYVGEEKAAAEAQFEGLLKEKARQFLKDMAALGVKKDRVIEIIKETENE